MKVIRIILLYKQGVREVVRLVHPSALAPVKLGNRRTPEKVIQSVWGFSVGIRVVFGHHVAAADRLWLGLSDRRFRRSSPA